VNQNKQENTVGKRKAERRVGIVFLLISIAIACFYLTWDGWLYEWQSCRYEGTNQHFDLEFSDLQIERNDDGSVLYHSTNNLHNLIYICYIVIVLGSIGLITGNQWFKQGAIAIYPISVVSVISTLLPLSNHLNIIQIAYDLVHLFSIILGLYCLYHEGIVFKKTLFGIFISWGCYLLARVLLEPWPYWLTDKNAYFSLNQINDMPFYFYGLEYLVVVFILIIINYIFSLVQHKKPQLFWKMLFPLLCSLVVGFSLLGSGMIKLQQLDMRANCPIVEENITEK
jgi:hypothetical protein